MDIKDIFKALSDKRDIKTTIFKKEFTDSPSHLQDLEDLLNDTSGIINLKLVKSHINLFKIGLVGESNVNFELRNSMLPMVCFHDVRLEDGDYTAQFDFIVLTHSVFYVIETKKLYGDIEVNENGEFIRKIKNKYGKVIKKEGMYSPVTQSQRHSRLLKKMLTDNGFIKNTEVKPLVVLANPKTIIDKKRAPKEVQDLLIKSDQLVNYLSEDIQSNRKKVYMLDKKLLKAADFIENNNKTQGLDIERYKLKKTGVTPNTKNNVEQKEFQVKAKTNKSSLLQDLKAYRLEQAKLEDVKAYLIFYNSTLDEIIDKTPSTPDELLKIKGFGEVKVKKYGEGILSIINKHR